MDFTQLDTRAGGDAGFEVQLRHPVTDEGLDAFICVYGQDSKRYEKAQAERARKWQRLLGRSRERQLSPQELKKGAVELLAEVTGQWRGIELDGEVLACNAENAAKFYERFPWVVEQLDAAVHERANFMRPASTD